jgi:hypothetical protein
MEARRTRSLFSDEYPSAEYTIPSAGLGPNGGQADSNISYASKKAFRATEILQSSKTSML